jgi:hypothetical protein
MIRREERLVDALDAAARAVRPETLRPLVLPGPQPVRRRGGWLTPFAAAAGVALVIGLSVALTNSSDLPGQARHGVPMYYAAVLPGQPVQVRATTTGKVTAELPTPDQHSTSLALAAAVAATPDERSFFAAYQATDSSSLRTRTLLYKFGVTASGSVTGFSPVKGGVLDGFGADVLAVSPDGSYVAMAQSQTVPYSTAQACPGDQIQRCVPAQAASPAIIVVNAVTAVRAEWAGGIPGDSAIRSLSWTGDGKTLAFLYQTMGADAYQPPLVIEGAYQSPLATESGGAVRTINGTSSRGGRLDGGRVLLRESAGYPYIERALISPDGHTVTALMLRGTTPTSAKPVSLGVAVLQVSVTGRPQSRVLYQGKVAGDLMAAPVLQQDGSGLHWIMLAGTGLNGWIEDGQLHALSPGGNSVNAALDAAW